MQKKKYSRSFETQSIYNLLKDCDPKDCVRYEEMKEAMKLDPQSQMARGFVRSALAGVQSDLGFVFTCIENVGYVRLTDEEIIRFIPKMMRQRIESTSRRTIDKMNCADIQALPRDLKQQYFLETAAIQTIAMIASDSTIKKLTEAQNKGLKPFDALKDAVNSLALFA